MKEKKYYPKEEDEQAVLVEYLELKGLRFSAIAQSTYTKSWKQKMKNKKMGVRSGLPDLMVIIPNPEQNILLFIELKRIKGGAVKQSQNEWIDELNKVEGVIAKICYGAEEAIKFIESGL